MQPSQAQAKGFFAGLFDFSFTTFITLKFIRIIYTVLVVLILLVGLVAFISFIGRGGGWIFVALILVPLVTLLYLILARLYLELVAVLFRIGENTSIMAASLGGRSATTGPPMPDSPPPGGYGGATAYGSSPTYGAPTPTYGAPPPPQQPPGPAGGPGAFGEPGGPVSPPG